MLYIYFYAETSLDSSFHVVVDPALIHKFYFVQT
jgi:hypothetical protein